MKWKVRCDLGGCEVEREFPTDEAMNFYVQVLIAADFGCRVEIKTEILDWGASA